MNRTLITLTLAACVAQTGAPMVVLLGGIVGAGLAPVPGLATLPVALMIVGTAMTTIPASLLMRRMGRKFGFIFAACYAAFGGLLAALAIVNDGFWLLCVATFLVGSHNAFVQQYRFAVAESVPKERLGRSLSVLMLAGVVAAYIGPKLATELQGAVSVHLYAGSFLGLTGLMIAAAGVLTFYVPNTPVSATQGGDGRPLLEIAKQPNFQLALASAVAAWSIMSLLMTATPVAMHEVDGFNMPDTAFVIQSHIMAMFLPSLVTGFLIDRFGAPTMIFCGAVILAACLIVGYTDHQLIHYWWSLVLLGVGWNFMQLGGTALLTTTYQPSEQFKVQAFNDFTVFALQAVAALSSGYLLLNLGWHFLIYFSAPLLVLPLVLLVVRRAQTPMPAMSA
ncbi:MAG: MFS transporter [Pseudomonadales bacterium]|jgi:predicted MFS family arabinose efflux permease